MADRSVGGLRGSAHRGHGRARGPLPGDPARETTLAPGIAVAEAVRSPLGTIGMDKLLVDGRGSIVVVEDSPIPRTVTILLGGGTTLVAESPTAAVEDALAGKCGANESARAGAVVVLRADDVIAAAADLDDYIPDTRGLDGVT